LLQSVFGNDDAADLDVVRQLLARRRQTAFLASAFQLEKTRHWSHEDGRTSRPRFSLPFLLTLSPQVRKMRTRCNRRFRLRQHFRMVIEIAFSLATEVAGLKISLALGVSDLSFYLV
jgi:hypothetical protein